MGGYTLCDCYMEDTCVCIVIVTYTSPAALAAQYVARMMCIGSKVQLLFCLSMCFYLYLGASNSMKWSNYR